jgi:hypothetical protein
LYNSQIDFNAIGDKFNMKKVSLSICMLVLLAILVAGCAPAPTPVLPTPSPIPPTNTPEPTVTPIIYDVEIRVTDEEGNSIPGAKIIQVETVEFADDQGVWSGSTQASELSVSVWAQGYLLMDYSSTLQPGDNKLDIKLSADPFGLSSDDLAKDGYELVFVEDFQDNISDCVIDGNGNVVPDDTSPGNFLLLVDLRNLNEAFSCSFGPTNLENAILEVAFRYPEIRYTDFKNDGDDEYYNWQGYFVEFRDGFHVEGYPIQVPWGPTLQINDFTEDEWKFPMTMQFGIQEERWYTITTLYDGSEVEVRMDGLLQFNFLKPPTMINTKPASIGAFSQAHIQFDNIKMWIPVD